MSVVEVAADGSILADLDVQRVVNGWLVQSYRDAVRRRDGVGSSVLMDFISACGESVRIREAIGVPSAELDGGDFGKIEVSVTDAAPLVGCSPEYLRRLARQGRVSGRKVSGVWLIDIENFRETA